MANDLISRKAAVKLLREKARGYFVSMFATSGECHVARVVATEAASEIANMPAVNAEPVVYCRACRHFKKDAGYCEYWEVDTYYDDYCSRGEVE